MLEGAFKIRRDQPLAIFGGEVHIKADFGRIQLIILIPIENYEIMIDWYCMEDILFDYLELIISADDVENARSDCTGAVPIIVLEKSSF